LRFFLSETTLLHLFACNYSHIGDFVTEEVGNTAAFLSSQLASAITGSVIYVDNGLNAMGVGVDSPIFKQLDIPKEQH